MCEYFFHDYEMFCLANYNANTKPPQRVLYTILPVDQVLFRFIQPTFFQSSFSKWKHNQSLKGPVWVIFDGCFVALQLPFYSLQDLFSPPRGAKYNTLDLLRSKSLNDLLPLTHG